MRTAAAIIAGLVLILGCGDDYNPSGPSGDRPQTGDWSGSAATGEPLAFTVGEDSVTALEMTVVHTVNGEPDTVVWQPPAAAIVGDSAFSASDSIDADSVTFAFSISGAFPASDSAQGTWSSTAQWQIGGSGGVEDLSGSWTATPSGN